MADTDQSYVKEAQTVIAALTRASELGKAHKRAEAVALLASIRPDVVALREVAKSMQEVVQSEQDLAQRSVHEILEAIANTVAAEAKTRQEIEATVAKEKADEAALRAAEESLAKYQQEIAGLRQKVNSLRDELHDNQDKLSKWWWVPGYGQYLAIRNLEDLIRGREGELRSAIDSAQDVARKMPELQQDAERLAREMQDLQGQFQGLFKSENQLAQQEGELEQAQKRQSAMVATSAKVSAFYDGLATALDDTKDSLDSTYQLAARLADPVEILDASGDLKPGTLQTAITYMAEHAEAVARRFIVFQTVDDGAEQPSASYRLQVYQDTFPVGSRLIVGVPFKVSQPCHLRSVTLPIEGKDLLVHLASGPELPEIGYGAHGIPDPQVLVTKQLAGDTPFGAHDVPMPGVYPLLPGRQYFIILGTTLDETSVPGSSPGSWGCDRRAKGREVTMGWNRDGRRPLIAQANLGALGLSLRIYGTAMMANLQLYV